MFKKIAMKLIYFIFFSSFVKERFTFQILNQDLKQYLKNEANLEYIFLYLLILATYIFEGWFDEQVRWANSRTCNLKGNKLVAAIVDA